VFNSISNPHPQPVELPPTAELDRTNDIIYSHTINLVRAITHLSNVATNGQSHLYIDYVKEVGKALKPLLSEADSLMERLPPPANRKVLLMGIKIKLNCFCIFFKWNFF